MDDEPGIIATMPTPRTTGQHTSEYISLAEHFNARLDALERALDARFAAIEKAQDLSCKTIDHRLNAMNEIRETMRDQSSNFVTKAEYDVVRKALLEDIRSLRESRAELAGKASQASVNLAQVLGAIALVISLATFILKLLGNG